MIIQSWPLWELSRSYELNLGLYEVLSHFVLNISHREAHAGVSIFGHKKYKHTTGKPDDYRDGFSSHSHREADAGVSIFGPKKYIRTTGKPDVYRDEFSSRPGMAKLVVLNGEADGRNRVSSALIWVNGLLILHPSDFNQNIYRLERSIHLPHDNRLIVELRSKPGSYLRIEIQVAASNNPPTANAGPDQTVYVAQTVTLDGSKSSDVEGDPLTFRWSFTSTPLGSGAVLSDPTAVKPTFMVDRPGTYVIQLIVNDGVVDSDPDTVVINVAPPPNRAPVAVNDTYTVDEDGTLNVSPGVLANDNDPDGDPITASLVNNVSQGSLTFNPNGSFTYIPNPGFHGMDGFTYRVYDGALYSNSATVTITVNHVNHPPVAKAGTDQQVYVGDTVQLNGSGSSDVDRDSLTYQWSFISRPAGSVAVLLNSNTISPSFVVDKHGTYVVQLIVNDGMINSGPSNVTISTINRPPRFISSPLTSAAEGMPYIYPSQAEDPDQDSLTFSLINPPSGMAIIPTTGLISWTPSAIQVGLHEVRIQVSDGKGGANTQTYSITVIATVDRTPPVVGLVVPSQIQASSSLNIEAQATDNVGVKRVSLYVDDLLVKESDFPPYRLTYNAPDQVGKIINIRAVAQDDAGNQGQATAKVTIVATPDTTPPMVGSIYLPSSAAPGESVTVLVEATDDRGVAEVRFGFPNVSPITDMTPPYEAVFQIPTNAVVGSTLVINIEVLDTSGNLASAQKSLIVREAPDTTPPSVVTIQAPSDALPGQAIQLSASAVDNIGILKVIFFADGAQVAEDTDPPYQIPFNIPESKEVGSQVVLHVQAVDFSDNRTDSSPAYTKIVSPGDGFIAGEVYDDATGLPIPNTRVRLISVRGKSLDPPQETSTDTRGRYWFVTQEGMSALEVRQNGFTSSYREEPVQAGKVNYFFNSRISPLGNGYSINHLTGGSISIDDNQINLYVPPGAFKENQSVTLNKLSSQGLPSPLPMGFTPLTAVHIGPENGILNSALELNIKGSKNLGGSASSALATLVAVYWDMNRHQWIRVAMSALPQDEGLLILMSGMGTVALIRPDAQPVSPNISEIGNALTGVQPQSIPDGIAAEVIRNPEVLFMQLGARSNVQIKLKNAEPLSSGTRIEVDFDELYERTDNTFLMPEPMTQDFILYQNQGPAGLESHFVASPSEIFDPVLLKEGIINLSAHKPPDTLGSGIIGLSGGTITSSEGFSITIPPGALNTPTPILLKKLGDTDPVLSADPRFQMLNGILVDLGGRGLSTSATLILTLSSPIAQDSQVLVIRNVMAEGISRYELVGIAAINGNTLTVSPNALGLPLSGVRGEGRYYFLRMTSPVGYVTGQVSSGTGPVTSGLVQENTLPIISLTNQTKPHYVMASPLGSTTIVGKDLTNGNNAAGSAVLDAKDQIVSLDLMLSASRPTIVSVSPNDRATGVQRATSITVKFSKPMDPSTINFSSFSLRVGVTEVQGVISLLPDQITAVFQPGSLLADNTLYTLRLSTAIKDSFGQPLFGNQADESFMTAYTTVDTTPPPRPEAGQIDVGSPVNGIVTISGTQGSVEPGLTVTVKNLKTGAMTSVVASNDGSFSISLQASLIDNLQLILLDKSGNETAMNMGRAPPPEGFGVVGGAGGIVEGEGGIAAIIPAGVLPEDTIVSITPVDVSNKPMPFGPGMEGYIGGAVALNIGDTEIPDVMELVFSIKGYPQYTVTDRIPLFEINRNFTLPQNLPPGTPLTLKITGRDKFGQSATLEAELPIVAANPNSAPRTLTTQTMPVLKLILPTEATPGQAIPIVAKAEPPDIKLRFPAPLNLTGQEQFILYEVHNINGQTYYDLSTTASLVTLGDGTKVIETNTPPYRGPRRSTNNLALAVYRDLTIGFAQAAMPAFSGRMTTGGLIGAVSGMVEMAIEFSNLAEEVSIAAMLFRYYGVPRPPDVSPYEFSVIPVPGGIPTTIQVFDLQTNNLIYQTHLDAIPPGELSTSVIVFGEDDNDPLVTATTSFGNDAVPLDGGISIGFTHLIDTTTLTTDNLYIEDESGNRIPTEVIYPEEYDPANPETFVVMVKPINILKPGTRYTLIATTGISRPEDGPALASEFRLIFTTVTDVATGVTVISVPHAKSFDILGNLALVAVNQPGTIGGLVNGFKMVDLTDPLNPQVHHGDQFDQGMLGRVRSIKGMKDANITTWNGSSITGNLAILSHGAPNVFSKIRYYNINDPTSPVKIGYTIVGASTEVLIECGDVQVIDTEWNISDIQVFDPCMNYVHGIPKVPAIPTVIDTDEQQNVYFINNGIGLMTVDLGRAIPYSHDRRGQAFGPSYLPADKAGGIVVAPRVPPLIPSQNPYLKIMSPADLSFSASPVVIEGEILSDRIDKVFINGFRAEIQQVPGANRKFNAEIQIHEGVNQIIATGYGAQGEDYGSVGIQLLRNYSINPLQGPGTVQISIPPLSVGGGSISVSASVDDKVRFDQLFINGQLVSEKQCPPSERHPEIKVCGWSGSGSTSVFLQPGANTIVATAIDVDEYDPPLLSYADLRVEEGVALAAETGGVLEIFDASSLTRIKTLTMPPGKAFRISIAKGVMTDIDNDGRTGVSENDDSDPTTVFDEIKNLAIIGGGISGILTFVDITEPHNATVLGYIQPRAPPLTPYRAWADSKRGIAYVAAGSEVLIVDITRPHLNPTLPRALWDQNNDDEDDRILKRIPISGKAIDIQVNKERGLAYVLLEGTGIGILKLEEACNLDLGVDLTRVPTKREVRYITLEKEREDLLDAIHQGMYGRPGCSGFDFNVNAALLSQGSSACIWREDGRCSTAYQPGVSDYDFELIVPDGLIGAAADCAKEINDCLRGNCDELRNGSVFEDATVFPVMQSVFEKAYRSVDPGASGSCGGGADPYGDLCLGRNGLILKWLLEGEWVRSGPVQYNNGIHLETTLSVLRSPMAPEFLTPDGLADPNFFEPSHIPRLEGWEWGCLEEFALNQSGARIRIKGSGLGDVPVNDLSFHKKIHKAAKAGIRAVYGKLLSTDIGNTLMLESAREEYNSDQGCFTATPNPDNPGSVFNFSYKRCESFEEYVASKAILSAVRDLRDDSDNRLLTDNEALFAYEIFRRKSDVGAQIKDEQKANDFIRPVMELIQNLRANNDVRDTYNNTIGYFRDSAQRMTNYDRCDGEHLPKYRPEDGAPELKLKIPARVYNNGYTGTSNVPFTLYHQNSLTPIGQKTMELAPGESRDFEFSIKPPELVLDGINYIQGVVDEQNNFAECSKSNNHDGFYYYILYPSTTSPPATPGFRPPTPGGIPDPPVSPECLVGGRIPPSPALQLIATVNGQYEIAVETGSTVQLEWIVRNIGNVEIRNIVVQDSITDGLMNIGSLAPGATATLTKPWTAPMEAGLYIGICTAQGVYKNLDLRDVNTGVASSYIKVTVAQPLGGPTIRILSPPHKDDPENPFDNSLFRTMADKLIVSGVVRSNIPNPVVKVNGVETTVTATPTAGLYEFETVIPVPLTSIPVTLQQIINTPVGTDPPNTELVAELLDGSGKVLADDMVKVVRLKPDTGLRMIALVNGKKRIRVKPGQSVTFSVEVINDGDTLEEVTLTELMSPDLAPSFSPGPFKLNSGASRSFSYTYTVSSASPGVIIHKAVAYGKPEDDNRAVVGPVTDSAEVWVGPPEGALILRPRLIFLPRISEGVQLSSLLTLDGTDVTPTSTGTDYEILLSTGAIPTLIFNAIKKIIGNDTISIDDVPIAEIEIDESGKLKAKSVGFNVIRAKHTSEKTGFSELKSNYALIIAGLELEGIDLEPHSYFTDMIDITVGVTKSLINALKDGVCEYEGSGWNIPMILTNGGTTCVLPPAIDPFRWMTKVGYAELVSIKFKVAGIHINGMDILGGARWIIDQIPLGGVSIGGCKFKPINWFIGKIINFAATQMVDFEIKDTNVADVFNFPGLTGIVYAKAGGMTKLTGTLSFEGYGSKSDDIVILIPELESVDVRPDENLLYLDETTDLKTVAKVGFPLGSFSFEIPWGTIAKYVPVSIVDPAKQAIAYLDKLLPGGFPSSTPLFEPKTREIGKPEDDLYIHFKYQASLAEITLSEIAVQALTPNLYNTYSINDTNIANLDPAILWNPLDWFRMSRQVKGGPSTGVTNANVEVCIPLLGTKSDNYIPNEGGGAEIIVTLFKAFDDTARINEGESIDIDVLANDKGDLNRSSVAIVDSPTGRCNGASAVPDGVTGKVRFTSVSASDCYGDYVFTYTVNDNSGNTSNIAKVKVYVNAHPVANGYYELVNEPLPPDVAKTSFHVSQLGTDPGGVDSEMRIFSMNMISTPSNPVCSGVMPLEDPVTGMITFELPPASGCFGEYKYEYKLADPYGGISQNSNTLVIKVNGRPHLRTPQPVRKSINESLSIPIVLAFPIGDLGYDSDPLNGPIGLDGAMRLNRSPGCGSNMIISESPGIIQVTYHPASGCFGEYEYAYVLRDPEGAISEEGTLIVEVNAMPIASSGVLPQAHQDGPAVSIDLTPLVVDPDNTGINWCSLRITNQPGIGSASLASCSPIVNYSPPTMASNQYGDNITFAYVVEDQLGAISNEAVLKVDVNALPVANSAWAFTAIDTPVVIQVIQDYTEDPDGNIVSFNPATSPANGSISFVGLGPVTYTPKPGFIGIDSFTYTVTDNDGAISYPATVEVWVNSEALVINEIATGEHWVEICNLTPRGVDVRGWTIAGQPIGMNDIGSGSCPVVQLPGVNLSTGIIRLVTDSDVVKDSVDMDLGCYIGSGSENYLTRIPGMFTGNDCFDYHWTSNSTPGRL
jgi:uncharacterized repeat protein (TIGR01451 family)